MCAISVIRRRVVDREAVRLFFKRAKIRTRVQESTLLIKVSTLIMFRSTIPIAVVTPVQYHLDLFTSLICLVPTVCWTTCMRKGSMEFFLKLRFPNYLCTWHRATFTCHMHLSNWCDALCRQFVLAFTHSGVLPQLAFDIYARQDSRYRPNH